MKKFKSVLNKHLHNNAPQTVLGTQIENANGDVAFSDVGYSYAIDTLSFIRTKVLAQRFYEIPIADFMPVDVGEGAWADEKIQNSTFDISGDFYEGDINTLAGNGNVAQVDTALAPLSMPNKLWAKGASWTIFEIKKAAAAGNWDPIQSKLSAMKKNWDLGIQKTAFLGHPNIALMTGLLNNASVNINTTLIPKALSTMTAAEFATFVKGIVSAYFANSNFTKLPNQFIMPADDYLGLVEPFSSTYPVNSKLDYLLKAFITATDNPNFKIRPLVYAQAAKNDFAKDRYVLMNKDQETLAYGIPVDFTILNPNTTNAMFWSQQGYGQYSGCFITRPREILYFDETTP